MAVHFDDLALSDGEWLRGGGAPEMPIYVWRTPHRKVPAQPEAML